MKGFYSRNKRQTFEERLKQEQKKFEDKMKQARMKQRAIIHEKDEIRNKSKLIEAKKRIQAIQKEEARRTRLKTHREKYIQEFRVKSREREINALDLHYEPQNGSKIPQPNPSKDLPSKPNIDTPNTKIPKVQQHKNIFQGEFWQKGGLLDSLDLSTPNLQKYKVEEVPEEIQPEDSLEKENWIRESIKEWAPPRIKRTLSKPPKPQVNNMEVIQQPQLERKNSSKFVNKIKSIKEHQPNTMKKLPEEKEFLQEELDCVNEEEQKLEDSLARLDLQTIKINAQRNLAELEAEAQKLEDSLEKLNPIPDNSIELETREEIHSTIGRQSIDSSFQPNTTFQSVFSAHPYPANRSETDNRSVITEAPRQGNSSVHRIGSVYNEVAARSGRYSKSNPPPKYSLPKPKQRKPLSIRKPPKGPKYTENVVKVNPNFNLKNIFEEEEVPNWARD